MKILPDTLSHDVEIDVTVRSIYHASDANLPNVEQLLNLDVFCGLFTFSSHSTGMGFIRPQNQQQKHTHTLHLVVANFVAQPTEMVWRAIFDSFSTLFFGTKLMSRSFNF